MPLDLQRLKELEHLDFGDKGEAFVEARFLTPLLGCLGYETHKDYEVIRHGDDRSSFKLRSPAVEAGAQRVKHYNPDYIPTIRKKMFWIVEAKSPKDVPYPFDPKYLIQGLQYCIHPEIQAKYLLVTNGIHSAVYDAHGGIFLGQEIYEPVLYFQSCELTPHWRQIFNLLSVETLRSRIEADLKAMYDKLCLSSLDKTYPHQLLAAIGASAGDNVQQIEKHVLKLYFEGMDREQETWREDMERLDAAQVYGLMDLPLRVGPTAEGYYFVEKSLAAGMSADEVFLKLTADFVQQPIFRKLQSWLALCSLYYMTSDEKFKNRCREFFNIYKDAELPLLNQVECTLLRLARKISVTHLYPPLRQRLQEELSTAPELIRYVNPPTAFSLIYPRELSENRLMFGKIRMLSEARLQDLLTKLLKTEAGIEDDFGTARSNLTNSEKQQMGFETYGVGGKHYAFKNILIERGLEPKS